MSELTKKAMLAKVSFSIIGMRKKDTTATTKANNFLQTSQASGMYQKCRISRNNIIEVIRAKEKASALHRKLTTPFTKDGWGLIAADLVMGYSTDMGHYKQEFYAAVSDVHNRWPAIVADEQKRLGPLFNQNEYPPQNKVKDFFSFEHELKVVPDEGHVILDLENEFIEEIKSDIRKKNQENMRRSIKDMWQRLFKPVANMADICSNDKRVYGTLIEKIEDIVDILPALNIINDADLNDMSNEIKSKLLGHTIGQIRDDKQLKRDMGAQADAIAAKMRGYMGTRQT